MVNLVPDDGSLLVRYLLGEETEATMAACRFFGCCDKSEDLTEQPKAITQGYTRESIGHGDSTHDKYI